MCRCLCLPMVRIVNQCTTTIVDYVSIHYNLSFLHHWQFLNFMQNNAFFSWLAEESIILYPISVSTAFSSDLVWFSASSIPSINFASLFTSSVQILLSREPQCPLGAHLLTIPLSDIKLLHVGSKIADMF